MSDTVKKYILVGFLTLLVWAWANKAVEKPDNYTASLAITQTTNPDILVTFDKPAPIELKIVVRGSSSKIDKLKNLIDTGQEKLDFVYSTQDAPKDKPEKFPLVTVKWLNQTTKIKSLGIIVESAEPEVIQVTTEKLVKKELNIECFDQNGIPRLPEAITPTTVGIFVKKDYFGKAIISLSAAEVGKAQKEAITKKPYVLLPSGEFRYGEDVEIKLPSTELPSQPFQPTKIGFIFTENLAGNYRIELINKNELTESTSFMASEEAFEAYKSSPYHILVLVLDNDKNGKGEEMSGDIIYNFPAEYFSAGKIKLAQPSTKKAKFKLIPINPPTPKEVNGI